MSHDGYNWKYFMDTFSDTEGLVMEAIDKRYNWNLAGDFALTLDYGRRRDIIKEFDIVFALEIVNGIYKAISRQ